MKWGSLNGEVALWVNNITNKSHIDNYIDFGLFNDSRPEVRMFINGTEEAILLDFNVSGTIYDKI